MSSYRTQRNFHPLEIGFDIELHRAIKYLNGYSDLVAGEVETLITRPVNTSHSGLSREERAAMGIADGLVRVACGIEAAEDLCADFAQALARV